MVFKTRYRCPNTAAIISLVVVLPALPTTATTGTSQRRRYARAMSPNACSVESTANSGPEAT